MITDSQRMRMIEKARSRSGSILPCGGKEKIDECFVEFEDLGEVVLFYNQDGDKSTKAIIEPTGYMARE